MLKSIARLEPVGDGMRQVIEIVVSDGYHPARIEARSGLPIRLVFRRRDDRGCTDRVVFSEPRLERRLAPNATTVVDLPTVAGREIRFTCGMGQYRGRIELLSPQAFDTGVRGRAHAALAHARAMLAILAARRRGAVRPHRHP